MSSGTPDVNWPAVEPFRALFWAHSDLELPTLGVRLPHVFVVMDVNLVELLRQQIFINGGHVPNHVKDQKTW